MIKLKKGYGKGIVGLILLIILGAVSFFVYRSGFFATERLAEIAGPYTKDFGVGVNQIPETATDVETAIKKEISAPAPLRVFTAPRQAAILTRAGVISQTNIQRKNNELPPLSENSILNQAAELKLKDMFARQYFAHVSPSGKSAGDLVKEVGYEYLAVGENLALGNFDGDKDLVLAWMNSPGHRANILSARFEEIGVAVGRGMYEGEETWLAVQEFAMPVSACPEPDSTLRSKIDTDENLVDGWKASADALRADLESSNPKTRKDYEEYNNKVSEYNALVAKINSVLDGLKAMIGEYNAQVRTLNQCVAG